MSLWSFYEKGGRPELAAQEREEITIIAALPAQADADQKSTTPSAHCEGEWGATAMKDNGQGDGGDQGTLCRQARCRKRRAPAVKKMLAAGEGGLLLLHQLDRKLIVSACKYKIVARTASSTISCSPYKMNVH